MSKDSKLSTAWARSETLQSTTQYWTRPGNCWKKRGTRHVHRRHSHACGSRTSSHLPSVAVEGTHRQRRDLSRTRRRTGRGHRHRTRHRGHDHGSDPRAGARRGCSVRSSRHTSRCSRIDERSANKRGITRRSRGAATGRSPRRAEPSTRGGERARRHPKRRRRRRSLDIMAARPSSRCRFVTSRTRDRLPILLPT